MVYSLAILIIIAFMTVNAQDDTIATQQILIDENTPQNTILMTLDFIRNIEIQQSYESISLWFQEDWDEILEFEHGLLTVEYNQHYVQICLNIRWEEIQLKARRLAAWTHTNWGTSCTSNADQFYAIWNDCAAGYYLQPNALTCLPHCPTGYTISGSTCAGSAPGVIASWSFYPYIHTIWTSDQGTATLTPGNVDPPISRYQKGIWFNRNASYHLSGLILDSRILMMCWLSHKYVGSGTNQAIVSLLSQTPDATQSIEFRIGYNLHHNFKVYGTPQSVSNNPFYESNWYLWSVITWCQNGNQIRIIAYQNSSQVFSVQITKAPFHDRNNGDHILGANQSESGDFFTGFMYKLIIQYHDSMQAQIGVEDALNIQAGFNCAVTKYEENGQCPTCPSECPEGCRRQNTVCSFCYDIEWQLCEHYNQGATCSACTTTGLASGTGVPWVCTYPALRLTSDEHESECILCHDRCYPCTAKANHYTQCTGCQAQYIEAQPSTASYKYCIPELPSGATSGTPISITTPLIFSVILNAPIDTFTATGVTGGTLAVTQTDPSGFPARNRGIHFDGTNHALIELPALVLYHTFSFHSWLYPFQNGSSRTIFSKDRDDFTTADSSQHITVVIGSDNKPDFTMAKDEDPSVTHSFKGNGTYGQDTWVYSIISGVMNNGYQTSITFYKNDAVDRIVSNDPIFMIDFAAYPAYLAAHRASTTTWTTDYFEGYIYEFHIYNEAYTPQSTTHYTTTGWTNSICTPQNPTIEIGDYDMYNNDFSAWDASCVNSWVDGEACVGTCGTGMYEEYCWLWGDRECLSCHGYEINQCESSKCRRSSLATEISGVCYWNPWHGRVDESFVCEPCHQLCYACNQGDDGTFTGCTSCGPHFDINIGGGFSYCVTTLPDSFTVGSPATLTGSAKLFHVRFDGPFTDQIPNSGAIGGDITVTTQPPSGQPAKYRGLYFLSSNPVFIPLTDFTLYHTCSFHFWVIPLADGVLFSKERNNYDGNNGQRHITCRLDNLYARWQLVKDDDAQVQQDASATSTYTLNTWLYLVMTYELDINQRDTHVHFYYDTASAGTTTFNNLFIVDSSDYKFLIGTLRINNATDYRQGLNAFLYEFSIYQNAYIASNTDHYVSGPGGNCNSHSPVAGACLWVGDYLTYNNGADHCHPSCIKSWVNDQPCQIACGTGRTEKYCWLCADKEWESCSGYGISHCISACTASGFASGTSHWSCNLGYIRTGLEFLCQDCYGACATCTGIAATDWSTCNDKNAHVVASGECQCTDEFYDSDLSAYQTWSICPENGYKMEDGRWVSIWTDGTYYDSQQAACLPWLAFWATCSEDNSCLTCVDTSVLYTQGECCGYHHFRDTYLQCSKCAALCLRCTSIPICTYCVENAVLINNQWECEEGYHIFEEGWIEDGEAPQLSIDVVSASKVQLSFDKQILQQLSSSNTEVILEDIDSDLYSYSMIEVEPGLTWDIVFDFADSVELKETKVDILLREKITDLNGNAIDESEYEAQLPDLEAADGSSSSSDENLNFSEEAIVETTKTTVQTLITAGILSGYVTGDLTSTWGFINTIQILAFIPLMDSQMPELLKTTLVGLLEFELIPNLFEFVLDEEQFVQQEPYDLAQEYGFDNNVFLMNWGGILVNAFMILWLIPIMLLLGKCKNAKIASFAQKSVYSYKWCFFLRVWIELHLEVGLAAYFQFMTPYWNNVTMVVNSLLGYFSFVITFLSFPLVLLFMIRNRRLIQERDELFYKIYGSLFEEFQNSMGTVSTLFYSWFFLRRTTYIITLIVLRDYVGYQLMMNLVHTLLTLLFLIIYRPYSDSTNNHVQIYSEIVTGIIFFLCACFHFEGARENSEAIKWTFLCLIMSVVVINLILTFVTQFTLLKAMCKKVCRKRTAKVDSVKQLPFKDTRSISSMNLQETEISLPHLKPEAIARSPEAVAMSFAKRRILAHNSTPDTMTFELPSPETPPPIIDQQPISSPEVEEADLTAEQQKALDYRMHKAAIKQQVARRVRSSYGAKPDYINFGVKPDKSVPVLINESIGSMDMDEIVQPQEYQSPSASQEQPKEDIAEVVARRIKTSYSTRPKYINFEPIFRDRSNNG